MNYWENRRSSDQRVSVGEREVWTFSKHCCRQTPSLLRRFCSWGWRSRAMPMRFGRGLLQRIAKELLFTPERVFLFLARAQLLLVLLNLLDVYQVLITNSVRGCRVAAMWGRIPPARRTGRLDRWMRLSRHVVQAYVALWGWVAWRLFLLVPKKKTKKMLLYSDHYRVLTWMMQTTSKITQTKTLLKFRRTVVLHDN